MRTSSLQPGYYAELFLLLVGFIVGQMLAWWAHGFNLSSPGELDAAREAGIVSLTTLAGYPKSRDTFNYLFALLLPVLSALLIWKVGRVRSPLGTGAYQSGFSTNSFSPAYFWLGIVLTGLWNWHTAALLNPVWNGSVGAWPLLGEQGVTLAWMQNIASGGVFGRDFFSLYGPMFVYPLSWLMDLTGNHSALMERHYKFLLQIIAFSMATFLLLRTLRSRLLAWAIAASIICAYPVFMSPSANTNLLRTVLALFALGAIALWIDTRQKRWLWTGGLVLGQSFLFAQEAAICAFGAGSVIIYLDALTRLRRHSDAIRQIASLWGITLLSMAPMLTFLVANGAGAAMLDSLAGYPKVVMMGFGAFQFPSMRTWLGEGFREHWLHYAVIAVYSGSSIAVALIWLKGTRSSRLLWTIGLTLFGIVMFRQALGRSGAEQTIKVLLPAVMLTALWLDEGWTHIKNWATRPAAAKLATGLSSVLLLNLILGIGLDRLIQERLSYSWHAGISFDGKFLQISPPPAWAVHPRVGFPLDPQTHLSVREIGDFLNRHTAPREPVYFFPNEAAYYHLFDRKSPTRYVLSYWAAPFDRQRQVIQDLEVSRPRFLIYSKYTWRIDSISESVQIPLIVDYLKSHYHPVLSLRTVEVFARN